MLIKSYTRFTEFSCRVQKYYVLQVREHFFIDLQRLLVKTILQFLHLHVA